MRRTLFRAALFLSSALALALYLLLRFSSYPGLDAFREREGSREYLDRYGSVICVEPLEGGLRRMNRDAGELPGALLTAFIAAEDRRFFLHPGVDPLAVVRSAALNLRAGRTVSGASTITMQTVRLIGKEAYGEPRGGLGGKILEALNALRLEARLSKEEILELWLNSLPFGFRCEGVAAAGPTFFGRPLEELSPAHYALLSVIPRSPALYDPVTRPEQAASAALAASVRDRGKETRYGMAELLAAAREARRGEWPNHAPHFTAFVGKRLPEGAGNRVRTTLDLELTLHLRGRIDQTLRAYADNRLGNGAALLADNRSGEILAYAGSRDFWDEEHRGQIDGVLTRNQPGSTLKPFLYTLALNSGFLPNTILPDLPLELGGGAVYQPMNFDGRFHGPVRLRVALASSLNVPAVHLVERLGVGAFSRFLIDLGFESLREQQGAVGTGLALGNAEVTLFELVQAYTLFSRGDGPVALTPLPSGGGRAAPFAEMENRYAVAVIRDILGDQRSRVPGFGPDSVMNLPFPSLFKTGTANQFQNIWAVGAVPEYTVGVWIGNFTGETVIGETGSGIPASIAAELLTMLRRSGSGYSPVPGARRVRICAVSGMLATDADPSTVWEYLPEEHLPEPCSWHIREEDGTITLRYPDRYAVWESGRRGLASASSEAAGPVPGGDGEMATPLPGSLFYLDPTVPGEAQAIRAEARGAGRPPFTLRLYLDGRLLLEQEGPLPLFYLPLTEKGVYRVEIAGAEGSGRAGSDFELR